MKGRRDLAPSWPLYYAGDSRVSLEKEKEGYCCTLKYYSFVSRVSVSSVCNFMLIDRKIR